MKRLLIFLGLGLFITIIVLFKISTDHLNDEKNSISQKKIDEDEDIVMSVPSKLEPYIGELSDDIIMSREEIDDYNQTITTKTSAIYDIYSITKINREKIKEYIDSYEIPSLPKYDDDKKITTKDVQEILKNRDLENVKDCEKVSRGLIVKRSNLRSFPTDIHFYNSPQTKYLDNIQETELLVNTPVIILHESRDKEWYFVLSLTYYGWIRKNTVAIATLDDWNYFLNSDDFVIVTDEEIKVDDTTLDMSTRLPFISFNAQEYEVVLPKKDENGNIKEKIINIYKEKVYPGYVPYTKKNLYIQALKYEGVPYAWGGYTGGVDCSSFVSNVFRTFGFQFPRNTSSQNSSVGKIIDIENKNISEKLKMIENHPASLLYQQGHVELYLGKYENKNYVIHANGTTLDVAITSLENSKYLSKINRIVLIE